MGPNPNHTDPILVVALGGNAMQDPGGTDTVEADIERTDATVEFLASLATTTKHRLVITHGNGPQVGNHLYRSELAHEVGGLPALPLDVCVADTQGGMGYILQRSLSNAFHRRQIPAVVVSLVTQVIVDPGDAAFERPSKPVGEMIPAERVEALRSRGWVLVEDPHRGGWRRVVASPDPIEIVEAEAIRAAAAAGIVVIAGGGGGIPVVQDPDGVLQGIPAVVDKDLASALLAQDLRADGLMILTDVEHAYLGYDSGDGRPLHGLTAAEARRHLDDGEFPAGSMGPKIEAACRFAEATGRAGIITSVESAEAAFKGETGTRIVG